MFAKVVGVTVKGPELRFGPGAHEAHYQHCTFVDCKLTLDPRVDENVCFIECDFENCTFDPPLEAWLRRGIFKAAA